MFRFLSSVYKTSSFNYPHIMFYVRNKTYKCTLLVLSCSMTYQIGNNCRCHSFQLKSIPIRARDTFWLNKVKDELNLNLYYVDIIFTDRIIYVAYDMNLHYQYLIRVPKCTGRASVFGTLRSSIVQSNFPLSLLGAKTGISVQLVAKKYMFNVSFHLQW